MLLFDASALVAWFDSHPYVINLWEVADLGGLTIGVPALAMVEAACSVGIAETAWDAFLLNTTVEVLPVGLGAAVQLSALPGSWGFRHTVWEARRLHCPILTANPGLYGDDVALLAVPRG